MDERIATSVYRYFDEHDVLLYVGITARGTKRQAEHNQDKVWWPYVARQTVDHFDTRGQALAAEAAAIRQFGPPFNTQHNPGHLEARATYLAFRNTLQSTMSPEDLVRSFDRKIPLLLVGSDGVVAQFVTTPPATPLASLLVKPDSRVMAIAGSNNCGTVRSVSMESGRARLEVTVRRPFARGARPFVRVRMFNAMKPGGPQLHVVSLQACSEKEQAEFRRLEVPA